MMNLCNKVNFVWETKGILLGIIYYILKKYNYFKENIIIINDTKIRHILKFLFIDLDFSKKGEGFHINIKNNERSDLVINNLNNLSDLHTKHIYLLPWYSKDNPIIMYKHKDEKELDVKLVKEKIKDFSKC